MLIMLNYERKLLCVFVLGMGRPELEERKWLKLKF